MEKGNVHIHTNESFSFDELEIGKSADRSSLSGRGTSTNTPVSQKLALSISHKSSLVDANGIDTAFEFALIGPDCSPVPGSQEIMVLYLSSPHHGFTPQKSEIAPKQYAKVAELADAHV